jgi:hypothetical protein
MLLLPEEVDDYVDADNPVRVVDAFVDEALQVALLAAFLPLTAVGDRIEGDAVRRRNSRCSRDERLAIGGDRQARQVAE